jgi:hypothetical protein
VMQGAAPKKPMRVRQAPFAIRLVKRTEGTAAILYRRETKVGTGKDRLHRIGTLSPMALLAGGPLVREGVRQAEGKNAQPKVGPCHALDSDWGARIACFAHVAAGLRDLERLQTAAGHLQRADAAEAAWWLGLLSGNARVRAVRALRILVEAVS